MRKPFTLSVVIPVHNEQSNVPELYRRLRLTLEALTDSYKILYVNDGSSDGTLEALLAIQKQNARVEILDLARNFGHQAAVAAGIDHAIGDAVVVMDGDLQDPPEVISQFVECWEKGYDVVYAVRKTRQEGMFKRLAYATFYRILRALADVDIPLDAGDFSLVDAKVVRALRLLPERRRFIRGLRSWVGYRQIGVPYDRPGRYSGETKYTLSKLVHLATSGLVSFSKIPLRLSAYLGLLVSLVAFAAAILVIGLRVIAQVEPQGWTSLMVVVLFLGGIQMITMGIIGEYVGYVLDEVKQRPTYIVGHRYTNSPE